MLPIVTGIMFGIIGGIVYCEITSHVHTKYVKQKLIENLTEMMEKDLD